MTCSRSALEAPWSIHTEKEESCRKDRATSSLEWNLEFIFDTTNFNCLSGCTVRTVHVDTQYKYTVSKLPSLTFSPHIEDASFEHCWLFVTDPLLVFW